MARNINQPATQPSPQSSLLFALAEFRYALRSFLRFSEQAAQQRKVHPQQHQLLLQIAGLPANRAATIGFLAERLGLRQNSMVELANRSVAEGLMRRTQDPADHRRVVLSLTAKGGRVLRTLSASHARELDEFGPRLIRALDQIRSARATTTTIASTRISGATALRTSSKKRNASQTKARRAH